MNAATRGITTGISTVCAWLVVIALACAQAPAQQKPKTYEPEVGQAGKDVVWVPTSQALVDKMLDLAKVTPQDFVMDLGSGDGRTVITAAKRGATALGIEYNLDMVELSKRKAAEAGVSERARFEKADLYQTDFSKATVITMFLLPEINLKLRPKLLELKPGTRIVSNSFTMEEWEADETASLTSDDECTSWCTALLWIVPAQVSGTWQLVDGGNLTLAQDFQKVSGKLGKASITGKLKGREITFRAGGATYTGWVNGNTIQGTIQGGPGGAFTAVRK